MENSNSKWELLQINYIGNDIYRIQTYNIDIWKNDYWQTIYTDNRYMDDYKDIRFPDINTQDEGYKSYCSTFDL